jgi:hypothetical protein
MSTRQIPAIQNGPVIASDTAATPNTLIERDVNGDAYVKTLYATTVRNSGAAYRAITSKSAGFTVDDTEEFITVDSTSADVTVALPAAAVSTGKKITIKKLVAAHNVIIDGNASETIDGATTLTLSSQYAVKTLVCDGTQWWVMGS